MSPKVSYTRLAVPYAVQSQCDALGERISVARRRRRLTQAELARRAGVSKITVGRIERGESNSELSSVVRVLWALGLERSLEFVAADDPDGERFDRANLPRRVRQEALSDDF